MPAFRDFRSFTLSLDSGDETSAGVDLQVDSPDDAEFFIEVNEVQHTFTTDEFVVYIDKLIELRVCVIGR